MPKVNPNRVLAYMMPPEAQGRVDLTTPQQQKPAKPPKPKSQKPQNPQNPQKSPKPAKPPKA